MQLPQLKRVRWAVRGVLTLGVAASVAANILHADPNLISEIIAAWPPLALLLAIELVSRVPVHRRWQAIVRRGGTTLIAGIAAWVSYWHMVGVAQRYGETGAAPYLLPLSVDGLVAVASVSLLELAGRIRTALEVSPKPAPKAEPLEAAEQPEQVADGPGDDMTSDSTRELPASAKKLAALRLRQPSIKQEEAARRIKVSVRTVARHWDDTAPDTTTTPDPAPVNGRQPQLTN